MNNSGIFLSDKFPSVVFSEELSPEQQEKLKDKIKEIRIGQTYKYNTTPSAKQVTILRYNTKQDGFVARDITNKKLIKIRGYNVYKLSSREDTGSDKKIEESQKYIEILTKDMEYFKEMYGENALEVIKSTAEKLSKGVEQ